MSSIIAAVVALAADQRGLITRQQLHVLGWSSTTISRQVAAGWLHRVHRGVNLVGAARLTPEARAWAAVLACGPGAAAAGRSAAGLLGLCSPWSGAPEVAVPGARGRKIEGIVAHRPRRLLPRDLTRVDGLPATSVARTLLDLAAVLGPDQLDAAIERAEQLRVLDLGSVEDVLDRHRGHRGRRRLRDALARAHGDTGRSRSELELRARTLLVEAGLPTPSMNPVICGYEVDLAWLRERVIVELDGWEHHRTRRAFERDRRRDAELQAAGYRVARFTWRQLRDEPAWVVRSVAALLGVAPSVHLADGTRHAQAA